MTPSPELIPDLSCIVKVLTGPAE